MERSVSALTLMYACLPIEPTKSSVVLTVPNRAHACPAVVVQ